MSRDNLIINDTFQCTECNLIYYEGDLITVRYIDDKIIHDCDNCLAGIELAIINDKITKK